MLADSPSTLHFADGKSLYGNACGDFDCRKSRMLRSGFFTALVVLVWLIWYSPFGITEHLYKLFSKVDSSAESTEDLIGFGHNFTPIAFLDRQSRL